MAKPASKSARAKPAAPKPAAKAPEPAVMAAGASEENALEGRGMPPADPPKAEDQAAGDEEGFRNDAGQFTGNPPTDTERLDALCDLAERNGWSLPKVLQRAKE